MRQFFRVSLTLVLLSVSLMAQAWSKQGHQIVGELAERRLSPAARAEVQALLAGEVEPTLAGVSTWADELRENDSDLGKRSSPWHYINFRRGQPCDYQPARDCPDGNCVVAAITTQAKILGDRNQSLEARRQALKFLVHFVGDVHQPLHAGYADDHGGNDHQINYRGKGSNLHRIWDYWIVQDAGLAVSAYADRLQSRIDSTTDATTNADRPTAQWALESCRIVHERHFYPAKGRLDPSYVKKFVPTAERRLRDAGRRLAALIETTLAPASSVEPAR